MSLKSKGTNAERELIHLLWANDIAAIRVAGSGSSKYPSPDIIAGDIDRKLAIECKSIKGTCKYIPKQEIYDLQSFCSKFGAEPWIGLRFTRNEWHFIPIEDMKETKSSFAISLEDVKMKGLLLNELLNK